MPSFRQDPLEGSSIPSFSNAMVDHAQLQWLFTQSELKRAPSIIDGMSLAEEQSNRSKGINFIIQVGILLKLPQLTLATASVYLHRFFMRHSMVNRSARTAYHHYSIAATALFLATKVEENCRKMRELVVACCRVAQKQPNLVVDEQSKEYWKWRDTILHNEDVLLEALCFDLQIEQPYRILYDFLCYYKVQGNKQLRNSSWAFLNDSHVTIMCLLFSPKTIAGAAFYAGARWSDVSFPDDLEGNSWWEHLDIDIFEIQQACSLMAEVYENPSLPRKVRETYFKDQDSVAFDKTRSAPMFRDEVSPAYSTRSDSQGIKRDHDEFEKDSQNPHSQNADDWKNGVPEAASANGTRSPKRLKLEAPEDGRDTQSNAHHPDADAIQRRIDDIVNGAADASSQPPTEGTSQHAARTEPSDPPYSTPANPQPSNHDRMATSSSDQPATDDNQSRTNGVSWEHHKGADPAHAESRAHSRKEASPAVEVDDSEKVDYGSEEGEL